MSIYAIFGCLLLAACLSTATSNTATTSAPAVDSQGEKSQDGDRSEGTIVKVIDGDTIEANLGGNIERVRLIGIDTPESVSRQVPVQCFGSEASAELARLVPPGTKIEVQRDIEARDRFGRLLLYIYRPQDNLFVNQWMVAQGFADSVSYEPNTRYSAEFTQARNLARANSAGLWSACDGPDQPLQ